MVTPCHGTVDVPEAGTFVGLNKPKITHLRFSARTPPWPSRSRSPHRRVRVQVVPTHRRASRR